jgi:hypothetical protein
MPDNPALPGDTGLPAFQGDTHVSRAPDISVKEAQSVRPGLVALNVKQGMGLGLAPEAPKNGMGLDLRRRTFDWRKKRRFLRVAKRFWPNVTICCAAVGISDSTFYTHKKQDKVFALKIAEVDRGITDRIEGVMADEAVKPASFLDRMAYLRAHRPELYNPARKIIVEGHTMSTQEIDRRSAALDKAVDAQIVNAYTTRKERAQAKREGSSLLPSGEEGEGGVGDAKA